MHKNKIKWECYAPTFLGVANLKCSSGTLEIGTTDLDDLNCGFLIIKPAGSGVYAIYAFNAWYSTAILSNDGITVTSGSMYNRITVTTTMNCSYFVLSTSIT